MNRTVALWSDVSLQLPDVSRSQSRRRTCTTEAEEEAAAARHNGAEGGDAKRPVIATQM
jgi:hypothetical protein